MAPAAKSQNRSSNAPKAKKKGASKQAKMAILGDSTHVNQLLAAAADIQAKLAAFTIAAAESEDEEGEEAEAESGEKQAVDNSAASGSDVATGDNDAQDEDFVMVNGEDAQMAGPLTKKPSTSVEPPPMAMSEPEEVDMEEETVESLKAALKKLQEDRNSWKSKVPINTPFFYTTRRYLFKQLGTTATATSPSH
ncbi:hypothetical protein V5O48_017936 [Marasmius crinis-equi]|uniref:Uncharacterized protein n=1 Tax=Marasmius crinis-equi TaxID=585013 RepID=A0ABR3EML4_9AGAR